MVLCFGSSLLGRWLTIFGVSGRVERRSIVSRSACRVGVAGEAILVLALAGRSGYVVGDESGSSEPPATPFESPGISGPSLKRSFNDTSHDQLSFDTHREARVLVAMVCGGGGPHVPVVLLGYRTREFV